MQDYLLVVDASASVANIHDAQTDYIKAFATALVRREPLARSCARGPHAAPALAAPTRARAPTRAARRLQ